MKSFAALLLLMSSSVAIADWIKVADEWPGLTTQQKQWFNAQHDKRGNFCCNTADGHPALWDIRTVNGETHYWAFWDNEWQPIPDDKVLEKGNAVDVAVIWLMNNGFSDENGQPIIKHAVRCFVPGPSA